MNPHPTCLNWMLELAAQVRGLYLLGFEVAPNMAAPLEVICKKTALACQQGVDSCDAAMQKFAPLLMQHVVPLFGLPTL